MPLTGSTAHDFSQQVHHFDSILADGWQTGTSSTSGGTVYQRPTVLVLYRSDQAFALADVIPTKTGAAQPAGYDLILAAQPYRSRTSAVAKVKTVLGPLAQALRVGGRLIVVQSTGHDPGMDIIRKIWPDGDPFVTPRHQLIRELDAQLNSAAPGQFRFESTSDSASLFMYRRHAMPNEVTNRITTSTTLAAWNAAVYVAQIGDCHDVASISAAVSRTVRVRTPSQFIPTGRSDTVLDITRPRVGFRPTSPHIAAGMRIQPEMSLPWAAGTIPAATAAADPPDEPPGVRLRSHGFRVGPYSSGSVVP